MHFFETAIFWEWLIGTLILITMLFLSRHRLNVLLHTNKPPKVGGLLILVIVMVILNLPAAPTGDEPHYLMMIQSLLKDGDIDLRNNYQQMDYLEYYPTVIPDPHVTIVGEHWYPVHGIGLPLLILPFFALGGRVGVVIVLVLMTMIGIRVLWKVLHEAKFSPKAIHHATLVSCLTLPLAVLSGQIFPEVPAFLLVVLGLQALMIPALDRWSFAGILFSLFFLPWLHPKYIILAMTLLLSLALTHHHKRERPYLVIASALFLTSLVGLSILTDRWYGVPLPGASILMPKAPFGDDWLLPLLGNFFVKPWIGLAGVLFDQQSGIFMASPIFILAIPGWIFLWRREKIIAVVCLIIFASVYLPAGIFGVWYGGFSSPARLLAPVVPVLAFGIAGALEFGGGRVSKLFWILALPSLIHAYLMMTLPSFTRYGNPSSHRNYFINLIEELSHLNLTLLFPSFRNITPITWMTTGVYVMLIIVITFLLLSQQSMDHVNNTKPSPEAIS